MSKVAIGDRVGAMESANNTTVRMYGFGVYQGECERPDDSPGIFGTIAEIRQTLKEEHPQWDEAKLEETVKALRTNPCIKLDNGQLVWGCQCWWGPEESVRKAIGEREVVFVPTPDNK